ncbi:unnamed protein product, partial [marine sediment metagenome]
IRGQVGINQDVKETLYRMRLRKKYSCIVINPTKEQAGMNCEPKEKGMMIIIRAKTLFAVGHQ